MGEDPTTLLDCSFNGSVKVEGRGHRLSADAGVVALREVDERLGLVEWLASALHDERNPVWITHPLAEILRTRLYLMSQGHRDQDDADRLRDDPACRLAVSQRRGLSPLEEPEEFLTPDGLASQPTQSRLVAMLSSRDNLAALDHALFEFARRDIQAMRGRRFQAVTLDVDSVAIEVHGQQAGSVYNGHYHIRCYHPIVTMLSETAHWLSAKLRPGNVSSAAGVVDHLVPLIDRVEREIARVASVRGDAGFPEDKLLSTLEQRRIGYAFRIKSNPVLDRLAEPHLHRPSGRPPGDPRTWFHELNYRASPWSRERRIVLVVLERPGHLFLDYFFLVTDWTADQMPAADLLEFYRRRGTMEGHLGELQSVLAPALSCTSRPKSHIRGHALKKVHPHRDGERANAVTFLLYALAYNLANSARRILAEQKAGPAGGGWSLASVRTHLLRVAARLVLHGRRAVLVMNDTAAELWAAFWHGLELLRPVTDTT